MKNVKKTIGSLLALILSASILCGCESFAPIASPKTSKVETSLNVTTTWSGKNMASQNYQKFIKAFSTATGVKIYDNSDTADEAFKKRVQTDFQVGADPDVMFYFTGSDVESIIKAGKVVSIDEIRQEYPDFASSVNEEAFQIAQYDGKCYSVPTIGYWEAMYVNAYVCQQAGVEIPDEFTTWDEFLDICEQIKEAGFTPITVSVVSEPHYWFEYLVYNASTEGTQNKLPRKRDDEAYRAWENALLEFKNLFDRGYFSKKCLYSDDSACFEELLNDEAAFCINGSWMLGSVIQASSNNDKRFSVTYVPGSAARKNTDLIGGFSSGWYISRRAWEDSEKRDAAVELVDYMTQPPIIESFASINLSATSSMEPPKFQVESPYRIQKDAGEMLGGVTYYAPAIQDSIDTEKRTVFMEQIKEVVTGKKTPSSVLDQLIKGGY